MDICAVDLSLPIAAANAGLFISRGQGRHPSRVVIFFDLIYVRTGVLGIQEDDVAFTVNPGESLLLWPNRHHYGTVDYPADLSFFWIHFTLREDPHPLPPLPLEWARGLSSVSTRMSAGQDTHPVSFLDTPPEAGGDGEVQGAKASRDIDAGQERGGGLAPVARKALSTSDAPSCHLLKPLHFVKDMGQSDGRLDIPQHASISRPDQLSEAFRRFLDDQQAG